MVKPVPDGLHTVTPHLVVKGGKEAIEFYQKAFGAEVRSCKPGPDGRVMHAELKIGDSVLYLADAFPEYGSHGPRDGSSPVTIHLAVEDADAVFNQAVAAGATVTMPLDNMFWGDRYGKLVDPFGHHWSVATHLEDLTDEQINQRAAAIFGGHEPCGAAASA
jgi:PhnB protein